MQYSKMEYGTFNTVNFPPLSDSSIDDLHGKSCHFIENYFDGILLSVLSYYDGREGFVIKILDENGKHLDKNSEKFNYLTSDNTLMSLMSINKALHVKESQFFFSIEHNKPPILTDIYDGKTFLSPGIIADTYGKRINCQKILKTEIIDSNFNYDKTVILKPVIPIFKDSNPIYIITC